MFYRYFILICLATTNLLAKPSEHWTPSVDYKKVIQFAKEGSPYYQGLLAICLRSGEFGSIVNIDLSRQWSEVAYKNAHPFGSYNLANISMLEGDFGKATEYYQDAALLLERKASDGDPISMYCMGEIDFQVIPTNVPRALEWFKKSAELGYSQAQATLGAFYLKGLPGLLEKDSKQGIELLAKAVRNKSLTARYNLGMAYLSGDGVPEDKEKAVQWLRVAEGQNFSEAQFTLGVLLIEGQEGVEKNTNEGLEFLRKAATNKHQLAKQYLEKRLGGDFSKNATRIQGVSQISTSDKETIAKAKKLFTGVGSEKDYSKAFQLFFPLAEGGNPEAARFVGLMKFSGKGTDKNFDEARQWLSVASQKGDKTAKDLLQKYKTLFE